LDNLSHFACSAFESTNHAEHYCQKAKKLRDLILQSSPERILNPYAANDLPIGKILGKKASAARVFRCG
jgi:hypothetical protein